MPVKTKALYSEAGVFLQGSAIAYSDGIPDNALSSLRDRHDGTKFSGKSINSASI